MSNNIIPFVEAIIYVFDQLSIPCKIGNLSIGDSTISNKQIITQVGLTGEIQGQVYLGLSSNDANQILSAIFGRTTVSTFNDLTKSAIFEITNMICGNTSIHFSKIGIHMDITPPLLVSEEDLIHLGKNLSFISIPIILEDIADLEMNIVIES